VDRTPIVHSVVRHYADWATLAPDGRLKCRQISTRLHGATCRMMVVALRVLVFCLVLRVPTCHLRQFRSFGQDRVHYKFLLAGSTEQRAQYLSHSQHVFNCIWRQRRRPILFTVFSQFRNLFFRIAYNLGSEVLTVVKMSMLVCWVIMCYEDGGSMCPPFRTLFLAGASRSLAVIHWAGVRFSKESNH
jgi:hypothetical protein